MFVYALNYFVPIDPQLSFLRLSITVRVSPFVENKVSLLALPITTSVLHYIEHNGAVYESSLSSLFNTNTTTTPSSNTNTFSVATTEARLYVLSDWELARDVLTNLVKTIKNSNQTLADLGALGPLYQRTSEYTYTGIELQPSRAAVLALYGSFYEYQSKYSYKMFKYQVGCEKSEGGGDCKRRQNSILVAMYNLDGYDDDFNLKHSVNHFDLLTYHCKFVDRLEYCSVYVKQLNDTTFERFSYYPAVAITVNTAAAAIKSSTPGKTGTIAPIHTTTTDTIVTYYLDDAVWSAVRGLGHNVAIATIPHTSFVCWLITPHQFRWLPLTKGAHTGTGTQLFGGRPMDNTNVWPAHLETVHGVEPKYVELNNNTLQMRDILIIQNFFISHKFTHIQWNELNVFAEDQLGNLMCIGLIDEYLLNKNINTQQLL